jgi:hypothetical protein
MSDGQDTPMLDMIRWTFTTDASRKADIESYLADHGIELLDRGEGQFVAIWDEPEGEVDEVVEGLWEALGTTFEVTHEEFRRTDLSVYEHEAGETSEQAAA